MFSDWTFIEKSDEKTKRKIIKFLQIFWIGLSSSFKVIDFSFNRMVFYLKIILDNENTFKPKVEDFIILADSWNIISSTLFLIISLDDKSFSVRIIRRL